MYLYSCMFTCLLSSYRVLKKQYCQELPNIHVNGKTTAMYSILILIHPFMPSLIHLAQEQVHGTVSPTLFPYMPIF